MSNRKKPAKKFLKKRVAADALIEAALVAIKRRPSRRLKRDKPPAYQAPAHQEGLHDETVLAPAQGLAKWIEANIVLPKTTAEPGPMTLWPWQYGLAEAFVDPNIERVSLMKGTRLGFTALCAAHIAYISVVKTSTILYVLPTENDARGFMVDDIEPMFECTPILQGRLISPAVARHDRNTLLHRLWDGGSLKVVAGKSPRNFRRHTAETLIVDEADAIEVSGEGDPIGLAERRTLSFPKRKIIIGGTPIDASTSHVLRSYNESDRRVWECPCRHCGAYTEITWEHIEWPPDQPELAAFRCPHCKELTNESQKEAMVRRGRWYITAPHITNHAGFRLNSLVSLLANCAWPKLAAEFLLVKDNVARRKVFVNTTLGQAWIDDDAGYTDVDLISRIEPFSLDNIPPEVLALVAGGDLGNDRTEFSVFGITRNGQVLVLSHETIWGSPEDDYTFIQLRELLRRKFQHPGGGMLGISLCILDAGYAQDRVIDFCATQRRDPVVLPGKGASGFKRPAYQMTRTKNNKRMLILGVDALNSEIYNRLARGNTIRFSNTLTPSYFEQLLSERKVVHYTRGRPEERFERKPGMRAETLDCLVYGFAAKAAYTFNFDDRTAMLNQQSPGAPRSPSPSAPVIESEAAGLTDDEDLKQIEAMIAAHPEIMKTDEFKELLRELEKDGRVINLPTPQVLPTNVNPATTLPGVKWRDWNGRPINKDGSIIGGAGLRVIAAAPSQTSDQPKAWKR